MATHLALPPLLPTAPPHSSSISSGSSPIADTPLSPAGPVAAVYAQQQHHHHHAPWPPHLPPPVPYPMTHSIPLHMVPPPAGGMSAPPVWVMGPPPPPQPYSSDPFKPYNANEVFMPPITHPAPMGIVPGPPQNMGPAGHGVSQSMVIPSIVAGPSEGPRYPPPPFILSGGAPMGYHPLPPPPPALPLAAQHHDPRLMASPPSHPNETVQSPGNARPRPHPYIRNTILYISSVAPQASEQDLAQVLGRHGIEYTNITLTPSVPSGERIYPNVYYDWMPKQGELSDRRKKLTSGSISFRNVMEVEKAYAILGCHPYFVGHLNMVISPFADVRMALPSTQIAPRIIRPTNMDLGLPMPWEGLIWEAARPWGSIKSVNLMFDVDNVRQSHDGAGAMPWKATIDFWYDEEAVAFENAINGNGKFLEWDVTVYKDPSFLAWTPPASGQWQPCPPVPESSWHVVPMGAPMQVMGPPVAMVESSQAGEAVTPAGQDAPLNAVSEAERAVVQEPLAAVSQKDDTTEPMAPPPEASPPTQGLQLDQVPPLPDHANVVSEQTEKTSHSDNGAVQEGSCQNVPTQHHGNTPPWRRFSGWRRPLPNFNSPMLPPSPPDASQPQSPWNNYHKHAGGMPLPATPPWDNVPLRGNFVGRGMGYPRKKNGRFRREWRQVEGGCVSNDGSTVQSIQAVAMRQGGPQNPRYFNPGTIDPYNLIVRGLEPDINANYLAGMFERFGPIVNSRVMRDEVGASRGFGFVQFTDPLNAAAALTAMNDARVGSRYLKVAYHQPRFPRPQWRPNHIQEPAATEHEDRHSETSGDQVGQDDAKTATPEPKAEVPVAKLAEASTETEVTEGISSLNVKDLTMESVTTMTPSAVLAMVQDKHSGILEHLDVVKGTHPVPHNLRGDRVKKIDIIRHINKIAPMSIQDMKRSDMASTVRQYVNGLSADEERALVQLIPYHKLLIALTFKRTK